MLTQTELKNLLRYDPETGIFTWLVSTRNTKPGTNAGSKNREGYIYITVSGKKYLAHRLALFYMEGQLPEAFVDHVNRNPADNRYSNLRAANVAQNAVNSGLRVDNTSGHKGVSLFRPTGKWRARGHVNGKEIQLGHFDRKEDAILAYRSFARTHHGQFINLS